MTKKDMLERANKNLNKAVLNCIRAAEKKDATAEELENLNQKAMYCKKVLELIKEIEDED